MFIIHRYYIIYIVSLRAILYMFNIYCRCRQKMIFIKCCLTFANKEELGGLKYLRIDQLILIVYLNKIVFFKYVHTRIGTYLPVVMSCQLHWVWNSDPMKKKNLKIYIFVRKIYICIRTLLLDQCLFGQPNSAARKSKRWTQIGQLDIDQTNDTYLSNKNYLVI